MIIVYMQSIFIDKRFKRVISFFQLKLGTREINPLAGLISHAREIY